jgi:hypothetical protein
MVGLFSGRNPAPGGTRIPCHHPRTAPPLQAANRGLEMTGGLMSETRSKAGRGAGWGSAWVTAVLAVSAAATLGFWLVLAVGEEDIEALESPLMLAVARQLVAGPWELYGPFGGQNPLVLIHAPLYYRAAALLAWPMARAGLDPVTAARVAGRSLSALGLLATLAAASGLARLGGAPRRAGWWAALLVAATPISAGFQVAVRPDMAGVALQTIGVLLVLQALEEKRPAGPRLAWAYAAFGLAACIKQHFVAAAAISTGLLLAARRRGRVSGKPIDRGILVAAVLVVGVYGVEGLMTRGRVYEAEFAAAGFTGRVHPADWHHVWIVALRVIERTAGLILLLAAAGLGAVAARPGVGRTLLAVLGTGVITMIVALLAVQAIAENLDAGALALIATLGVLVVVLPLGAVIGRTPFLGDRLDAALGIYLAGEVALGAVLVRMSTGAWDNYAIQGIVFASVLAARAASRVVVAAPSLRVLLPIVLAAGGVLLSATSEIAFAAMQTRADRSAVNEIISRAGQPPSAFFFAGRPGLNRVHGRRELVYDDWLYPVFEQLGLAEPRSRWLGPALESGPIRVVVNRSRSPRIEGVEPTLSALGYRHAFQVGPSFYVWMR